MTKTAVIFGVSGQDGSYLSELLLEKDYKVVGVIRRSSSPITSRIDHLTSDSNMTVVEGDVTDLSSIYSIIENHEPDEIYNLAAQSHVGTSFSQPLLTWDVTAVGCLNLLEAIVRVNPGIRFYQASSSEMFGDSFSEHYTKGKFQNEDTPFNPQSPYAIAKLAAHNATELYRKIHGLHASSGILFNHESERRGEKFVTRKISRYVADLYKFLSGHNHDILTEEIIDYSSTHVALDVSKFIDTKASCSIFPKLGLGNLSAGRDWGYAKDYVEAMWLMLQKDDPETYVISTGKTHSVKDFLSAAFQTIGIVDYQVYVTADLSQFRPSEVPYLKGDSSKAKDRLGWEPRTSFQELVNIMVQSDLARKQ